ncbi:choline transporter [Mycolicibacterium peregrinum]|uniref:BCCT family transporter n=1 Tax=Mycolicibacterium peregrinum TaxID=43304 RepID=UPI0007E9ED9F|nr:BCCT family transporter [Mycolicibacterium peregrinum]OBF38401.1 choline transporter [Mycolicibacterium peregrinum]
MPAEIRNSRPDKNTHEAKRSVVKKTEDALKSVAEVVPHHPVLDVPVEQKAYTRRAGVDWVVFGVTAVIALAFLVWGFVSTDSLATASKNALGWVMADVGWLFVLTASGFVIFVIWLAMSRYGNIPLGRDDDEPEFRTVSWVAMMFSAGMGIGLMFFGVSEPLSHFDSPPPGTGGPGNPRAAETAMATTMFHWTLHPWAIYAVVGLTIAYGVYRKGRLQLVSAAFEPLLGKHANGPWGKVIDMLAIFATLFGSAASLGLGALQIRSGLHIVAGIGETGNAILVGIIAILTVAFVLSAVSGVARGIQWLSNINMVLAVGIALFIFLVGPTMFMLNMIPTSIGSYVDQLAQMAARTGAEGEAVSTWLQKWTIFYWAWWISWTPFVGMFIARISRGRTIRQFVTGVLLVPSVVSVVWFCVFGGAAIFEQENGVDLAGMGSQERQLFSLLGEYPIATVTSVVVMVLVAIFFVSGADAASIVMGSLSERGTIKPTRPTVIFWGVATGAVAAVMLLVGGADALNGLQSITIIVAVPFVLVMIGLAVALVRDLRQDPLVVRREYALEAVNDAVVSGVTQHGDDFVISVEKDPQADDRRDAVDD